MSTIAKFVIEMAADPNGVRTGLAQAEGYLRGFAKRADQQLKIAGSGDLGGKLLGERLMVSLENTVASKSDRIREQLFRGVLSPEKARAEAAKVAQAMNLGILAALEGVRAKGLVDPEAEHFLISKLSDTGLKAGEAFADSFNRRADTLIAGGRAATKIGGALLAAVTLPTVAIGGLAIKEAIGDQTEMNRLTLAFGENTAYVQKQLDGLYAKYPAQKQGLEGMASGAGIALQSVGILGKQAVDMSIGLVKVAGGLALIKGADPARVMEGLERVLAGNTRGLIQYDVILKQNAITTEAERLKLIHHGEALNDTQRAIAAYSAVVNATAPILAKTGALSESAANQLRFLKRDALEAATTFGRDLLPAFTDMVKVLAGVARGFNALSPNTRTAIVDAAAFLAVLGPLLIVGGKLAVMFGTLAKAAKFLAATEGFGALAAIVAPGAPLLIGLGLLLAAILAVRFALKDSDPALAAFETSLKTLDAGKLGSLGAGIGDELARKRAELTRTRALAREDVPSAISQLGPLTQQIELLEAKSGAVKAALQALAAAKVPKTVQTKLGGDPAFDLKETIAHAQGLSEELSIIEQHYQIITRNVTSLATLSAFGTAQYKEQASLVSAMQSDMAKLDAAVHKVGISDQDRVRILKEQLALARSIALATDRGRIERGVLAAGGAQLGALEATGNIGALEESAKQASIILDTFAVMLGTGLLPQTTENIAALEAFRAALAKAGNVIDAAHPLTGSPRTGAELLADRGRKNFNDSVDSSQRNSAIARSEMIAEWSNLSLGFKRVFNDVQTSLYDFARELSPANLTLHAFSAVASVVSLTFGSMLAALNPVREIATAVSNAAKPLAPFFAVLGKIVGSTLAPVFRAFAPVLESLLPLFSAIFSVIGPILRALAPLFGAFVPILNALFPVFRLLGIVLTYLGQAIAITSGVIFKVIGTFAVVVGGLIAAIGSFISHIPFLGGVGRDIRDFGDGIKNFGHGALSAADSMFKASDEFARAREAIKATSVDTAADSIKRLGDTADAVTSQLLNVPAGYKVAQARYEATLPRSDFGPGMISPPTGGASYSFGDVYVDAKSMSRGQLFDMIMAEGRQRARADGKTHWTEVES